MYICSGVGRTGCRDQKILTDWKLGVLETALLFLLLAMNNRSIKFQAGLSELTANPDKKKTNNIKLSSGITPKTASWLPYNATIRKA